MKKTITTNYSDQEFRQLVRDELRTVLSELEQPPKEVAQDDYVNMAEAMEILQLSKSTIYKYVHYGKLKYIKQGVKRLLFKRSDLQEWINDNRFLDKNGTAPDGWNEKMQQHVIYEQPRGGYDKD